MDYIPSNYLITLRSTKQLRLSSGVASIGARGAESPLTAKKLSKIGKKREKNREKERKIGGKIEKKRKNREEKAKIGKVLSLCPS